MKKRRRASEGFVAAAAEASGRPAAKRDCSRHRRALSCDSLPSAIAETATPAEAEAELGDVSVAVALLCDAFPRVCRGELPPIVLRSQLRQRVSNETLLARELRRLTQSNVLRAFEGGVCDGSDFDDEEGLFFVRTADYVGLARNAALTRPAHADLFARFEALLPLCTAASVESKDAFLQMLRGEEKKEEDCDYERALATLAHAGFLVEKSGRVCFAVPNAGRFLSMMRTGREELLGYIQRRRPVREMLLRDLREIKLRRTIFSADFHLSDLIGRGMVVQLETPLGTLVRLAE